MDEQDESVDEQRRNDASFGEWDPAEAARGGGNPIDPGARLAAHESLELIEQHLRTIKSILALFAVLGLLGLAVLIWAVTQINDTGPVGL